MSSSVSERGAAYKVESHYLGVCHPQIVYSLSQITLLACRTHLLNFLEVTVYVLVSKGIERLSVYSGKCFFIKVATALLLEILLFCLPP